MRRLVVMFALVTIPLSRSARADIAPEPLTTGGTTLTPRTTQPSPLPVTMLWEEVDIHPLPQNNAVAAVFCLKNTGKENIEIEVGFPSYFKTKLQDFKVRIDGKDQAAELKNDEPAGPKKVFKSWMCWRMSFPPGQERKVEVSYRVPTERGFPPLHVDKLPEDLKAKIWAYKSGYVLRTGAAWADKIGKAVIRIHYGDVVKKALVTELHPLKGWKYDEKADIDTLTLENFKPTEGWDVAYQFKLVDAAQEAELLLAALKEKKLDPWAMEYLLKLTEKDNPRKLSKEDQQKRVVEILEWMLPPNGPEFDQDKITRGAENVLQNACRRLLEHYRKTGQNDKAADLGRRYQGFLKNVLDRNAQQRNSGGLVGREYAKLEKEYKALSDSLGQGAPASQPAPKSP